MRKNTSLPSYTPGVRQVKLGTNKVSTLLSIQWEVKDDIILLQLLKSTTIDRKYHATLSQYLHKSVHPFSLVTECSLFLPWGASNQYQAIRALPFLNFERCYDNKFIEGSTIIVKKKRLTWNQVWKWNLMLLYFTQKKSDVLVTKHNYPKIKKHTTCILLRQFFKSNHPIIWFWWLCQLDVTKICL